MRPSSMARFLRRSSIGVTVGSIRSSGGRSRAPAAASRRPVVMATLPNSAADWSPASARRRRGGRRDINAARGKSRQISLGRSNLSFIARINVGARHGRAVIAVAAPATSSSPPAAAAAAASAACQAPAHPPPPAPRVAVVVRRLGAAAAERSHVR